MSAYVDIDHTTCLNSRPLVSGGAIQLARASIAWFSKTQQVFVLSSSDKEYCIALVEMVKEVLYFRQVQQFILPNEHDITIQTIEGNHGGHSAGHQRGEQPGGAVHQREALLHQGRRAH